jgi:hypothetical protein
MPPAKYTPLIVTLARLPYPFIPQLLHSLMGKPMTILPPFKSSRPARSILDNLNAQLELNNRDSKWKDRRKFRAVQPNPRRLGSLRHDRYNLIREGMTIGEYLSRGGLTSDITSGLRRGHYVLED